MRDAARYGLLADIVKNPADDTPRLILADWLEENGADLRANVIRQMIAEPRWFDADSMPTIPSAPDFTQPFSVLRAYEWLSLHADHEVQRQYGLPSEPDEGNHVWNRRHAGLMGWLHWRRGFVEAATLPWVRFRYAATRLFRTFPIERIALNDLHPETLERDEGAVIVYCWNRCDGSAASDWPDAEESSYLAPELFDLLPPGSLWRGGSLRLYSTRQAAYEALSDAALALGRRWRDDPLKSGELA